VRHDSVLSHDDTMTNLEKRAMRLSTLLFPMLAVLAIGGLLHQATEGGMLNMKQSAYASDALTSKPLIDTQVPKMPATASFAMG
jgi:hypothetical protein